MALTLAPHSDLGRTVRHQTPAQGAFIAAAFPQGWELDAAVTATFRCNVRRAVC